MRRGARARGAPLGEIEAIYRARLPQFRRVAAAIVQDREAACDAVQNAFAQAVRQRQAFRGEGPLEAWLWRAVVNAARNARRDSPSELPVDLGAAARANGDAPGANDRVRAAIALLPERQRHVLFLRYYADLDYRTIAEALDLSPGTVGATLNAAHASMRALLEEVPR
jgi:RNA polymerase sigma-70 factor, ECF subfamily